MDERRRNDERLTQFLADLGTAAAPTDLAAGVRRRVDERQVRVWPGRQTSVALVAAGAVLIWVLGVAVLPGVTPQPTGLASSVAEEPSESAAPSVAQSPEPSASEPSATDRAIPMRAFEIRAPIPSRLGASGVWTGTEAIIWGGWEWDEEGFGISGETADGAAYDTSTDSWRTIGPAPLEPRARHLAVWTGREMVVWGGEGPRGPPDGAAYNPATDRWRTIAEGPLPWTTAPTSVWADDEWIIAVTRRDSIDLAAYDPARDAWRVIPSLPGSFTRDNWVAWTGSELLLVNASDGTFRLPTGSTEWLASEGPAVLGPIVSASDRLFGMAPDDLQLNLVEWVSGTGWQGLSPAPGLVGAPISTGERILFAASGLAYDPASAQWIALIPPPSFDRQDHVAVWSGDRLIIWGGWVGGPSVPFDFGLVFLPEW